MCIDSPRINPVILTAKERKKEYDRIYYKENINKIKIKNKTWATNNPGKMLAASTKWRITNPEKQKEATTLWRANNTTRHRENYKEWCKNNPKKKRETEQAWYQQNKQRKAETSRLWRTNNPDKVKLSKRTSYIKSSQSKHYCIRHRMLGLTQRALHKKKGGKSWTTLVDFTLEQLIQHLEKQFTQGMTWENRNEWHIDHKIPIAAFNFEKPEDIDFKRCFALKNLQPMWAKENMSKGAKLSKPHQPCLLF